MSRVVERGRVRRAFELPLDAEFGVQERDWARGGETEGVGEVFGKRRGGSRVQPSDRGPLSKLDGPARAY